MSTPTLIVAAATGSAAASVTSAAIGAGYAIGTPVLVYGVSTGSTASVLTVTDSKSNTYTKIDEVDNTAGAAHTLVCFLSVITAALLTSDTITLSHSGGTAGLALIATTVATSTGQDTTSSPAFKDALSTSATTSVSVPALTIAVGSVMFTGLGRSISGAVTPGGSLVALTTTQSAVGASTRYLDVFYDNTGTGGAVSESATIPSGPYSAIDMALVVPSGAVGDTLLGGVGS